MTRGSRSLPKLDFFLLRSTLFLVFLGASFNCDVFSLENNVSSALLNVVVNGKRYPDQEVVVINGEICFSPFFAETLFAPFMDEESFAIVGRLSETDGYIRSEELGRHGFGLEYDEATLTLRIRIPPRFSKLQYLRSQNEKDVPNLPLKEPAFFSGRLNSNFRATQVFALNGADPYSAFSEVLEGAVNIGGWVGESSIGIEAGDNLIDDGTPLNSYINYAHLVRDFRDVGIRMTMGTVYLPWQGFQSNLSSIGVNFTRNDLSRYPGTVKKPQLRAISDTFDVETSALVSISLNGNVLFSTRVQTGRYRFADLPFVTGLNEVEIEIAETDKEVVRFRLGVPYDSTALRRGASNFALGFGFDDETLKIPFISGFLNYGLTDTHSVGVSTQLGFETVLSGLFLSTATNIGLFKFDGAISYSTYAGIENTGYALSVEYRYSLADIKSYFPRFSLKGQIFTPDFSVPSDSGPNIREDTSWLLFGQISQATQYGFSLVLSGSYGGENGFRKDHEFQVSLGLNGSYGKGTSMQAGASINYANGTLTPMLSFSLVVIPEGDRSSLMYRQDLATGETSTSINKDNGGGFGSLSYSLDFDNVVAQNILPLSVAGSVKRIGRIGDLGVNAGARDMRAEGGKSTYATIVGSNGLVFADGIFALSRKVPDSFVILAPDASFDRNPVEMRYGADSTVVEAGGRPKAAALLSAYRDSVVEIDTPGSPPDVTAKENRLILRPSYKSGIVVKPKKAVSVFAYGRLLDASGAPLPWIVGRAETADGTMVGDFFTDEKGRFEVYELAEGSYIIKWGSEKMPDVVFDVRAATEGSIDLGTISVVDEKGDPK